MNKKFLSAILFGALMVTSTGTFVSCKDYDDDIDAINKELTDVKSQIAALQAKVDAGKWITSASQTAAGVTITLSDGSSLNITNGKDGKDGAQGAAGQDGKNGTVVTVNENGVLCLDGVETAIKVAEEAPAAKPCVKVENYELYVLNAEGEYVASGIKACGVTAVNTNGVWTITVDGESITVPGSAALTSIAIQGSNTLVYNYGYFAKDVEWGFKGDLKTAEAGFYSRLKKDVDVLLNPAEADGTAFTYTFRNSVKAIEDLTFFGKARPSTAVLTRAASGNGVWTLPAEVTKHAATSITELRNELYLNFKQNDKEYYAMSLEAIDGLGNVSTRSDYEYKITLAQASDDVEVADMNCLVGQEYYPVVDGAVIDYQIQVYPSLANDRMADAFGIEITEDGKGFIANSESAVYNSVKFQVAYVTINGKAESTSFTASFKNEFTDSEEVRIEAEKKPLNATLYVDKYGNMIPPMQFVIKNTYDFSKIYETLSEDVQMILDAEEGFTAIEELIGGESNGDENYNTLDRNTDYLLDNIDWVYDPKTQTIEVSYFVSAEKWEQPEAPHKYAAMSDDEWDLFTNFQLNTAYQLNLTVVDNGMELAKFELPFEFSEPTVGIERQSGRFSKWGTINFYKSNGTVKRTEPALYVYGVMGEPNLDHMYLPLYDAFTAWKPETSKRAEYEEYVDDAKYYNLYFNVNDESVILGECNVDEADKTTKTLEDLDYNAEYAELSTFANGALIKRHAELTDEVGAQKEFFNPIHVDYQYYGVYPKYTDTYKWTDNRDLDGNKITGENVWNTETMATGDFNLVFASWLKHSTLKMEETSYTAAAGTHTVFISNDDLDFTTPFNDAFYLFDDLKASGKIEYRADLNINAFNEIEQHPFTTVEDLFEEMDEDATTKSQLVHFTAKQAAGQKLPIAIRKGKTAINVVHDDETGKAELDLSVLSANDSDIRIYPIAAVEKTGNKTTGFKQGFPGGMVIVLPTSIQDGQSVIVTVTLEDNWGYKNSFDIKVKKLK